MGKQRRLWELRQRGGSGLGKIGAMLYLNIEALTILSALFVRDNKDTERTQLINISSCGGYTIVPTAVTYCAAKFYVSTFTEGLTDPLFPYAGNSLHNQQRM